VTRYIRWQMLLILLGIVLLAVLLTYLAINYTTVLRPGHGGTYVEGVAGYPRHLSPLLSGFNPADQDLCSLIFSGLTRFNEHGEVEPDLASSWEIGSDGLSYTFHLRTNAYWHDGTPVTADDVILTIRLLQDPDFPGPAELGGNMWRTVKIEKIDRRTVRFELAEPFAPFIDYTTVGILPSHKMAGTYAADLPQAEFNLAPVGSGPFQVEKIETEDGNIVSIVLQHFPRYFRARPYLDRVQFRFYPSHRAALRAYQDGEVEGVARVRESELATARELADLNLFSAQVAEYAMVFFNLDRADAPFFQEREVRQSLMYALDREWVVDEVLRGQGMVSNGPILPGTWAYNSKMPAYRHDPDRAAALLDEAGWVRPSSPTGVRHKGGQLLAFTLLTSNDPLREAVAKELAAQWTDIGVDVTVEAVSSGEVCEALEARDFQAALALLRLPGDPDPYPFWHETQIEAGQNYAGFVHRRISEVLERARVTVNRNRREELYDEFQVLFAEQLPSLPLYVPVYTYGVDARIQDVQIGPLMVPSDRFRTILDWWIVHRRVFVSEAEARP
jgi:peptide/nickel transport system substrate-binding protein